MKNLLFTGWFTGIAVLLLQCASGNRARQSFEANAYEQARILCKKALQADSTDTEARLLLARTYLAMDSLSAADASLNRALEIGLPDPESRENASGIYLQLAARTDDPSDILYYLKKAEHPSPESPDVLKRLGAFYEQAGELEEAKIRYEKLVMLVADPTTYGFTLNTLETKIQIALEAYEDGLRFYRNNTYGPAIKKLSEAVHAYPGMNEAVYFLNLSRAKLIQSNPNKTARKQARRFLNRAAEADPGKAEPHFLLARFYEMENDKNLLDEAIDHYSRAYHLEPEGPFAKKSRSKARSLKKKKDTLDKFWNN